MSRNVQDIRREPMDRTFFGLHGLTTVEDWREGPHMIKGVALDPKRIVEPTGDGGEIGGCGFKVDMTAELPQNTMKDYDFYDTVLNGKRSVAIVTGTGRFALLRLFRPRPLGAGRWADNRLSIVTSDKYGDQMDKATMKISGWIREYERYWIVDTGSGLISVNGGKLLFAIAGKPAAGTSTTKAS